MDIYIKKYWEEEDILYYLHFKDGFAVRQIEITEGRKILLPDENPVDGEHFLYDQKLEDMELEDTDYINAAAFDAEWSS